MKKLILLLFVVLSFSACKKDEDDVTPRGTAGEVLGTYELTSFMYRDGQNPDLVIPTMPVVQQGKKTYFGTVELTEVADPDQVNMVLKVTLDNQKVDDIDFETVDVEKNGSKYDLLSGGEKFASISGNTLSFDVSNGQSRLKFTAER